MSLVLVADDDADIARFVQTTLQAEGFEVAVVHDGAGALDLIRRRQPDLLLLDVDMPGIDGVEVCRRLREEPATAGLPVVMMTAKTMSADRVIGLTAGADDYVIKPFDTLELVTRVRSTLRRNSEMRAVSPLTGLPGNRRIGEEILRRSAADGPFAVCHVDLDNFKGYNDRYGWLRGDDVITLLAECLTRAAAEAGPPPAFIGHVGGDDFVVVCTAEQVETVCGRTLHLFDQGVVELYDRRDRERGFITVVDRQGREVQFGIVSVSIGVAVTGRRHYQDYREMVSVATEMKSVAKRTPGSAVAIDRRSDAADTTAPGPVPPR